MDGPGRPEDEAVLARVSRTLPSGAFLAVFIRETENTDTYPSGYKYRMHYGYPDEPPVVRYDNGHGGGEHHRHEGESVEFIEFPGIDELYRRFNTEVRRHERA